MGGHRKGVGEESAAKKAHPLVPSCPAAAVLASCPHFFFAAAILAKSWPPLWPRRHSLSLLAPALASALVLSHIPPRPTQFIRQPRATALAASRQPVPWQPPLRCLSAIPDTASAACFFLSSSTHRTFLTQSVASNSNQQEKRGEKSASR
jgi:hypothetical protein